MVGHDEIKIVRGRRRAFLGGELVGLSCSSCRRLLPLKSFNANKDGYAGKHRICKNCNKQYLNDWRGEQPHKYLASTHNTRARQHGTKGYLDEYNTDITLACAGVRTINGVNVARCQVTGEWTSNFDVCHVQSLKVGGSSEYANIFIASRGVNIRQGNVHLLEWLLTESAYEIANPEYVEWLITNLAQRNMKSVKDYVVSEIGLEGYTRLKELYFEEYN
ncbi:hypothetical protein [Priestia flexa]|uniref:hypothetical protein n=1 Tax=Priestia flexa TaxID=86664 RepID=UPI0032EB4866